MQGGGDQDLLHDRTNYYATLIHSVFKIRNCLVSVKEKAVKNTLRVSNNHTCLSNVHNGKLHFIRNAKKDNLMLYN